MNAVREAVGPSLYDDTHKIAHAVRDKVAQGTL